MNRSASDNRWIVKSMREEGNNVAARRHTRGPCGFMMRGWTERVPWGGAKQLVCLSVKGAPKLVFLYYLEWPWVYISYTILKDYDIVMSRRYWEFSSKVVSATPSHRLYVLYHVPPSLHMDDKCKTLAHGTNWQWVDAHIIYWLSDQVVGWLGATLACGNLVSEHRCRPGMILGPPLLLAMPEMWLVPSLTEKAAAPDFGPIKRWCIHSTQYNCAAHIYIWQRYDWIYYIISRNPRERLAETKSTDGSELRKQFASAKYTKADYCTSAKC